MTYRNSWDYIYDICDPAAPSAKRTFIENFLDMPEYVEKLSELLSLVPHELYNPELGQAWSDIARFQVTIRDFYESESDNYSTDLNELVSDLVSKIRAQREVIEAEVDKRHLRYAFGGLSAWEPVPAEIDPQE